MDEQGATEIHKPPPPNPGIYACCGRNVADGHPKMCMPQHTGYIILGAWIVFGVTALTFMAVTMASA